MVVIAKERSESPKTENRELLLLRPLCWCKRQLRRLAKHISFLLGKLAFEAGRVQNLFPLIRRHGAQIPDGRLHHLLPVRREVLPLPGKLARLLFLLWRQVLPGFDPVQAALLLLGRQAVEVLQAVFEPLLLGSWQLAECWIVR